MSPPQDFIYLAANICQAWRQGLPATEGELEAFREAAPRAGGPDLISAIHVLAEHGNDLAELLRTTRAGGRVLCREVEELISCLEASNTKPNARGATPPEVLAPIKAIRGDKR